MDWRERTSELLAQKNMSQQELANEIGVTKAAVSVWLKGKRPLSEKNTTKLQYQIASILNVSPEYLISGVSKDDPNGRSVPHLSTIEEIEGWLLSGFADAATEWSICPCECSAKTFSFSLVGSAMDERSQGLPALPNNSKVFVDPDLPLEMGKLALFKDQAPVVGIFEEMNSKALAVFSNPRFPALEVVRDNFIGRVLASINYF